MALPPQQFCVRWNSYHTNLQAVFPRLLLTEQFADVTLACESRQLRCHKLVLSACSAYLERLLLQNPCKHPIVLMRDMRFSEMQALVDFMYKGEVNVTQEELPSLLKSAEALQIRGLCSSDNGGLAPELGTTSKDYTVASEQLVAHATAQRDNSTTTNGASPHIQKPSNGPKKRKSSDSNERERDRGGDRPEREREVKEETVEEDGLFYGELDNDNMEYNEDEEPSKPGSSLGQSSDAVEPDFAIANVQCHYESGSDGEEARPAPSRPHRPPDDHTYDTRDEPPAFIIHQIPSAPPPTTQAPLQASKIMTLGPGYPPAVNVIHVGNSMEIVHTPPPPPAPTELCKRIRRSEELLKQAADCVSRGFTFQMVSDQFNIPISTIRFFMARKGILPRRRRGRSTQAPLLRSCSPEPPFHMQHFKLPDMLALQGDDDDSKP